MLLEVILQINIKLITILYNIIIMSSYLHILIPEILYKNNNNAPKEIRNLQKSIKNILKINSNSIFDEMQKGINIIILMWCLEKECNTYLKLGTQTKSRTHNASLSVFKGGSNNDNNQQVTTLDDFITDEINTINDLSKDFQNTLESKLKKIPKEINECYLKVMKSTKNYDDLIYELIDIIGNLEDEDGNLIFSMSDTTILKNQIIRMKELELQGRNQRTIEHSDWIQDFTTSNSEAVFKSCLDTFIQYITITMTFIMLQLTNSLIASSGQGVVDLTTDIVNGAIDSLEQQTEDTLIHSTFGFLNSVYTSVALQVKPYFDEGKDMLDVNNCNLCYETYDDEYCMAQSYCKEVAGIEADGVALPRFNLFTVFRSAKQAIPISLVLGVLFYLSHLRHLAAERKTLRDQIVIKKLVLSNGTNDSRTVVIKTDPNINSNSNNTSSHNYVSNLKKLIEYLFSPLTSVVFIIFLVWTAGGVRSFCDILDKTIPVTIPENVANRKEELHPNYNRNLNITESNFTKKYKINYN